MPAIGILSIQIKDEVNDGGQKVKNKTESEDENAYRRASAGGKLKRIQSGKFDFSLLPMAPRSISILT